VNIYCTCGCVCGRKLVRRALRGKLASEGSGANTLLFTGLSSECTLIIAGSGAKIHPSTIWPAPNRCSHRSFWSVSSGCVQMTGWRSDSREATCRRVFVAALLTVSVTVLVTVLVTVSGTVPVLTRGREISLQTTGSGCWVQAGLALLQQVTWQVFLPPTLVRWVNPRGEVMGGRRWQGWIC